MGELGGAIFVKYKTLIFIIETTFNSNEAVAGGNFCILKHVTLIIYKTILSNNKALYGAG